jgi:predicted transcriptional regulator YdeE
MPEHNYEPARDEDFELYDSRFIPDSDESLLFIMIPVNELKETKHE